MPCNGRNDSSEQSREMVPRSVLLVACSLAPIASLRVALAPAHRCGVDRHSIARACSSDADPDIDPIVQAELREAFKRLEAEIMSGEGDEARSLELMEREAATVLNNVMKGYEADGEQLRSDLNAKIQEETRRKRDELMSRYDRETAGLRDEIGAARDTIATEVERLKQLNAEYKQLRSEPGGAGPSRDAVVSTIGFIVGLVYVGASLNELLKARDRSPPPCATRRVDPLLHTRARTHCHSLPPARTSCTRFILCPCRWRPACRTRR